MRRYVIVTGVTFGLLAAAHVWRMVREPHLATDPWYLALTVAAALMSLAAWRVARRPP
ncbi:MAG TPA: hypothetical protein VFH97_02600 [Gemmatimonadales bacterium]|nr:hypothetical protein [Gemmatimonadales bacterium]